MYFVPATCTRVTAAASKGGAGCDGVVCESSGSVGGVVADVSVSVVVPSVLTVSAETLVVASPELSLVCAAAVPMAMRLIATKTAARLIMGNEVRPWFIHVCDY